MSGIPRLGPRAPRLLLFDLDDTLCDYAAARDLRLRRAFGAALRGRAAAGDVDLDQLIAASLAIHPHAADHFPELLARHGVPPEAADAAVSWYRINRFHGLALFADALSTIHALRAGQPDRPIGLITNGPTDVQREKIELLGLDRLVDFAVVSGEVGIEKPDPAIFREALRQGGAPASAAIYIGDSPEHDIAGARATGITAVWVNRTGQPWSRPEPPPEHQIVHLAEVISLLARLEAANDATG